MNKKSNKGITLIALVVTIIVLLILAGVSIAMLANDNSGILSRTTEAQYVNIMKTVENDVKLAHMGIKMHITSNMLAKPGYIATGYAKEGEDNLKDLAEEVAKELNAPSGGDDSVAGARLSGASAKNISNEKYTVAYFLDDVGTDENDGDGYIAIWYTDNSFRSALDRKEAIDKYKLIEAVEEAGNTTKNQAALAYVIHVTNYDCELSDGFITSTGTANKDIEKTDSFSTTTLYTKLPKTLQHVGEGATKPVRG